MPFQARPLEILGRGHLRRGSDGYLPGDEPTAAADIYALTLMTYTLLVGKAYWGDEAKSTGDVIAFAMLVVNGPQESAVQRAARYGVALPLGFDAWFAKGTAVNPADRFPTASEAVRALRAVGGPASPGVAPVAPRLAMVSDAGMLTPASRPAFASAPMLERAANSTGASAMTAAPLERGSRVPLVVTVAMLGLGVLGAGGWLALRQGHAGPELSSQVVQATSTAPPAASSAAPVEAVPSVAVSTLAPTANATAVPAPSAAVIPAPSTRAPTGGRGLPKPAVSANKPVVIDPNKLSRQ